jgi:hypothetical protein
MLLNTPARRQLEHDYIAFYANVETLIVLLDNIRRYYDLMVIEARNLQLERLTGTGADVLYGPILVRKRDDFVLHFNSLVNYFVSLRKLIEGEFTASTKMASLRKKLLAGALHERHEKSLIVPLDYIRYVVSNKDFKKVAREVLTRHIGIMKICNTILQKLSPVRYNVDILSGIVERTAPMYTEQRDMLASDLTTFKHVSSFFENIISSAEKLKQAVQAVGTEVENFMRLRNALFTSMRGYRNEQKLFDPYFTLSTADAFSSLSKRMLTLQKLKDALDVVSRQKSTEIERLKLEHKVEAMDPTIFRIHAPHVDKIEQEVDGAQILVETQLADGLGHISELQSCLKYCKGTAEQCVSKLGSVKKKDKKAVKKQLAYLQALKNVAGDAGRYIKIIDALTGVFDKFSKKYSSVIKQTVSDLSEIHEKKLMSELEKTRKEAMETSKYILGAQSKVSPTVYSNIYRQLRGGGKEIMKQAVNPRKKTKSGKQYRRIKRELKKVKGLKKVRKGQIGAGAGDPAGSGVIFNLGPALVGMPQEVHGFATPLGAYSSPATVSPVVPSMFVTEVEYQKDLQKQVSNTLSVLGVEGVAKEILSTSAFKFNEYLSKRIEIERMYNSVITDMFNSKERGVALKPGAIDTKMKERNLVLQGLDNMCKEDKDCVSMMSLYDEFVKKVSTIEDEPDKLGKEGAVKKLLCSIIDTVFQFESVQRFFKCSSELRPRPNGKINRTSSPGGLFGHTIEWNMFENNRDHVPSEMKNEAWYMLCEDLMKCKSLEEIRDCPKLISPVLDMYFTLLNSDAPCTYTCVYYSLLNIYGNLLVSVCKFVNYETSDLNALILLFSNLSLLMKFSECLTILKQFEKEFLALFCGYMHQLISTVFVNPHMWTLQQVKTQDHLAPKNFVLELCNVMYNYYKGTGEKDKKSAMTRLSRYIDASLAGDIKSLFGTVLEFLDFPDGTDTSERRDVMFLMMTIRVWLTTFLYSIEKECVRQQSSLSRDIIVDGILTSALSIDLNEQELATFAESYGEKLLVIPNALCTICSDILNYTHDVTELVGHATSEHPEYTMGKTASISTLLSVIQNIEIYNLYLIGKHMVYPAMTMKKMLRMVHLMIRGTRQFELEKNNTITYILATIASKRNLIEHMIEKVPVP